MNKQDLLPSLLNFEKLNKKQEKGLKQLYKDTVAMKAGDRDADDWFILGYYDISREDWDEAIESLTLAAEKRPDFEAAYRFRAMAWIAEDLTERAEEDLNKALEIDEDYADARYERAEIYAGQDKTDEALKDALKVLEDDPEHLRARLLVAQIYSQKEEYEKAAEAYSEVLEEMPDQGEALAARGLALFFAGNAEDALKDIKRARMLDGSNVVADFNVGLISAAIPGKAKEAYRHFEKAFRKESSLLDQYVKEAKGKESSRLLDRLDAIVKDLEAQKNDNFYTEQLYDLLESKLRRARGAMNKE